MRQRLYTELAMTLAIGLWAGIALLNADPLQVPQARTKETLITGRYSVSYEDAYKKRKLATNHKLVTNAGKTIVLRFLANVAPPRSGRLVTLRGRTVRKVFEVSKVERIFLADMTNRTTGPQNICALLVNFQDTQATPCTPAQVDTCIRRLNDYWSETSNNIASASGRVFGWITLPRNETPITDTIVPVWTEMALKVAYAQNPGVDFTQFNRILLIVGTQYDYYGGGSGPQLIRHLDSSGREYYATSATFGAYVFGGRTVAGLWYLAHELGHSFGEQHAEFVSYTARDPLPAAGIKLPGVTVLNYGDPFDCMGGGFPTSKPGYPPNGTYTIERRQRLGWLEPGNVLDVLGAGYFRIREALSSGNEPIALRLRRTTGQNNDEFIWLEFRTGNGFDASLVPHGLIPGVYAHWEVPGGIANFSYLFDSSPSDGKRATGQSPTFSPYFKDNSKTELAWNVLAFQNEYAYVRVDRYKSPYVILGAIPATIPENSIVDVELDCIGVAPPGGVTVSLSASEPRVQVPATVTIPFGQRKTTFSITTVSFPGVRPRRATVSIVASHLGKSYARSFVLVP